MTTVIDCYILFITEGVRTLPAQSNAGRLITAGILGIEVSNDMHIIVNNTSMIPIYEQIMEQVKTAIINGELTEDTMLPSVRGLSKELKISALTVKKAYDNLEQEGFTVTVHGKGTFVAAANQDRIKEERQKEVEQDLERTIVKARRIGLSDVEIRGMFDILLGE